MLTEGTPYITVYSRSPPSPSPDPPHRRVTGPFCVCVDDNCTRSFSARQSAWVAAEFPAARRFIRQQKPHLSVFVMNCCCLVTRRQCCFNTTWPKNVKSVSLKAPTKRFFFRDLKKAKNNYLLDSSTLSLLIIDVSKCRSYNLS